MGRRKTFIDVFEYIDTKENDPDVCWPWTGYLQGTDLRGRITIAGVRYMATHVVWMIFNGPIPAGMLVRHKCDNPICCNPNHLELGTRSDNEKDKYKRDRAGYTHDMIKEMFRLEKLGLSVPKITERVNKKFGTTIHVNGVRKVLKGERRADTMKRFLKQWKANGGILEPEEEEGEGEGEGGQNDT